MPKQATPPARSHSRSRPVQRARGAPWGCGRSHTGGQGVAVPLPRSFRQFVRMRRPAAHLWRPTVALVLVLFVLATCGPRRTPQHYLCRTGSADGRTSGTTTPTARRSNYATDVRLSRFHRADGFVHRRDTRREPRATCGSMSAQTARRGHWIGPRKHRARHFTNRVISSSSSSDRGPAILTRRHSIELQLACGARPYLARS